MREVRDLTGCLFGQLTVVEESHRVSGKRRWACRCNCGSETVVYETHLLRGNTKSCRAGPCAGEAGCHTPGYSSWLAMMDRCNRPKHPAFQRYGGRGIKVCERWSSFRNFHEDMGDRPDGLTLERMDGNGDYTPENCRWASRKEQQNNLSTNRRVSIDGEMLTVAQAAERMGVPYQTLYSRLSRSGSI